MATAATQSTTLAPAPGDFAPVSVEREVQQISRPSLSYWQDAWRRLKANRRALISLYIVIGLALFTIAGPMVWQVDPAAQDVDQVSRGPAFASSALVVSDYQQWTGVQLQAESAPAGSNPNSTDLPAATGLELVGEATTQAVRMRWDVVPGAGAYQIYRSIFLPANHTELGIPLGETWDGGTVSFEDRLALQPTTYYYSVLASPDGLDASTQFSTIEVQVAQVITARDASQRGLIDNINSVQPGDTVALPAHPLGTDALGRDMLARLMHGARVSLFIGVVAPLLYVLVGTLYGGLAGFLGGAWDQVLMRFADFVVALPFLLFMILFRIAFGIESGESGIMPMLIAMIILLWPGTARLVRGQILQIREEGYVQAAQLLGGRTSYIILRHMIPNTMGVILVTLTFAVPSAIFTEAFLSFIGMGVAPPTPSWGSMCNEGLKTMLSSPHELIFPALLISITVLAFNLLGDGMRDALDARMRSRE